MVPLQARATTILGRTYVWLSWDNEVIKVETKNTTIEIYRFTLRKHERHMDFRLVSAKDLMDLWGWNLPQILQMIENEEWTVV